jgi:molybdopterin converting factor small subunit
MTMSESANGSGGGPGSNGKGIVKVKVPTMMRARVGDRAVVEGSGSTLRELLQDLDRRFPGFTDGIVTEHGSLHRFVNLYLNEEDVRYLGSLETKVGTGDTVAILPAVAGG